MIEFLITVILLVLLIKKTIKLKFIIAIGLLAYSLAYMFICYNLSKITPDYGIKTNYKQINK